MDFVNILIQMNFSQQRINYKRKRVSRFHETECHLYMNDVVDVIIVLDCSQDRSRSFSTLINITDIEPPQLTNANASCQSLERNLLGPIRSRLHIY